MSDPLTALHASKRKTTRQRNNWKARAMKYREALETYDILKDGEIFASFTYGDPSRFGKPFDREIAGKEYDACRTFWKNKGVLAHWELRVHEPNAGSHRQEEG